MRKKAALALALLLLCSLSALGEGETGVYRTLTGDGTEMELKAEGRGTLTLEGQKMSLEWTEQDGRLTLRTGGDVYQAAASGQFLMLSDTRGHIWALLRDDSLLPEAVKAESLDAFSGTWEADFALVSGIRIDMQEKKMVYRLRIDHEKTELMEPGMEESITVSSELADGYLVFRGYDEESRQTLVLREDGSLTREVSGLLFHFLRTGD